MHALLCAEDSEPELRSELAEAFPQAAIQSPQGLLLTSELELAPGGLMPHLVFARQWLPGARPVQADSIRAWAQELVPAVAGVLPDDQPWSLHIEPHYGARAVHRIGARAWHSASRRGTGPDVAAAAPAAAPIEADAGRHRCQLIRDAVIELLRQRRRHLLRRLRAEPAPFSKQDSLVQLWLTSPQTGFVSVALAPAPFDQRHLLSPFPKGAVPLASDKAAPSRAFAKLVEAQARFGRSFQPGETCVDLGASPGSWTYVAARQGARVLAIDRSPLRADLMSHPRIEFQAGDAFRFRPRESVDWLLCDVIAAPERNAALLLDWLRHGWCRQFVVTLKLKDSSNESVLRELKGALPALTGEYYLTRLSANKKEVCAFGTAAG